MIRVALVEDTPEDHERFQSAFNSFCKESEQNFELSCFEKGEDFLRVFDGQFDILFMDIELPDADGVELCKKVRETDNRVVIAFLTNLAQYAIKGYEVDAIDFMLKPLVVNIFAAKMKKIVSAAMRNQASDVNIVFGGKRVIRSGDIIYAEVIKHDLTLHTTHGSFTERYALKDLESKLENSHFSRPNYCYLVNLEYVVSIRKFDLTLRNGDVLQISRNRKKGFSDDFSRYLGGSL